MEGSWWTENLDRVRGMEARNEYEISVGKLLYRRLFGIPERIRKNNNKKKLTTEK